MAQRLKISNHLLQLHPNLTKEQIRAVVNTVWKCKSNKLRQAYIFRVTLTNIGTLRSVANKKPKHRKNTMKKDRKRKREEKRKKDLTTESLLF